MKEVIITQEILDYIEKNKTFFEFDVFPKLGEEWLVVKDVTYPVACNGEPVYELEFEADRRWMRLPKDVCVNVREKVIPDTFIYHHASGMYGKWVTIVSDNGLGVVVLNEYDDSPNSVFISNLSVTEKYRGRGIGTKLLNECERLARKAGKKFIELNCKKNDKRLVDWYKRNEYIVYYADDTSYRFLKML